MPLMLTVRSLARGRAIPVDVVGFMPGIFGRNSAIAMGRLERRRQELADWLTSTVTELRLSRLDK